MYDYDDMIMDSDLDFDFDDDFANEAFGPFGKRRPLEKTLASAEKKIRRKCKSVAACNEVAAGIKTEAAKFTAALKDMQKIAKDLSAGKIDKKQAAAKLKPIVSMLKKTSDLVSYGQVVQNKNNITDEDIKFLKSYITGLSSIVKKVTAEVKSKGGATEEFGSDECDSLTESLESMMIYDFELDSAFESDFDYDYDYDYDPDYDLDFDF